MVLKAVTISFSVTGLVPSASEGTSFSLLWRTPMARARLATREGPTCIISCAVMVFFDFARPSRSVIGWLVGAPSMSPGRQTWFLSIWIATGWSISVSFGWWPISKAAPYTKGLKVEPGWRRACCTWSNLSSL
jgi:hypothetical protein